jgi:hypothetical protein
MSSSGVYNYWPKVNNPDKTFIQMESDGFQKPFYFGGSQVPVTLGINGSGISSNPEPRPMYKVSPIRSEDDLVLLERGRRYVKGSGRPIYKDEFNTAVQELSGKGLNHNTLSLSDHNDKIYIPRHLASLHK